MADKRSSREEPPCPLPLSSGEILEPSGICRENCKATSRWEIDYQPHHNYYTYYHHLIAFFHGLYHEAGVLVIVVVVVVVVVEEEEE